MVNPRLGGFVYILRLCRPFELGKSGSFFCYPSPLWFLQPEVTIIYLPGRGTLGFVVWSGADTAHFLGILPIVWVPLPPFFATPPLRDSTLPTHLDGYVVFKSLVVRLHTDRFSDGSRSY